MRQYTAVFVVACLVGVLAAPLAVEAVVVSKTIFDLGNKNLDGNVNVNSARPTFVIGTPGAQAQDALWYVSKFDLAGMLPAGTTSADIISASISVPDQDQLRNGMPGLLTYSLEHFETLNDTTVTFSDRSQAALSVFRPHGGGRFPRVVDLARSAAATVTAEIKADILAGRPLSSWRWGVNDTDADLGSAASTGDNYQISDSNAVGTGFDSGNFVTLTIDYVPEPSTAILLFGGALGLLGRRARRRA